MEYLKGIISRGTSSSTHRASLASCYQRLGEYGKALEHAKLAVEADAGDSDVKWMHEVLSRQKMAVDKMCEAEATLQGKSSCLRMPEPVQVQCMCSAGRGSICVIRAAIRDVWFIQSGGPILFLDWKYEVMH